MRLSFAFPSALTTLLLLLSATTTADCPSPALEPTLLHGLVRFRDGKPSRQPVSAAARTEPRPPRITKSHSEAQPGEGSDWRNRDVPSFECPDASIQEIYAFRWRVFHKHMKQTPDGFVVTEFLPPVSWAGKHNTISCAAGHHFREGRWLHESRYLDDYARFWFQRGGEPRRYSFWAADSVFAHYLVSGDITLLKALLPNLIQNYEAWEKTHRDPNGLYWQIDDRDGMEYSLGGSGYRPTINSYQYGDAIAIASIAELLGQPPLADQYRRKAAEIKRLVQIRLWDPGAQFFETLPRGEGKRLANVRELVGFVPWYFRLPDPGYESAWKQLTDPEGFAAPFGPTTAERRNPRFMEKHEHDCLWNGPSWPYATTQTLVALANVLHDYEQQFVGKADYLALLHTYARSQYKNGKPWVAEDLDPLTGKWIVDLARSADYNHSGFADLVITGLIGLRPRADDLLDVHPLLPEGTWDYFCLDRVRYHGRWLTILYDRTGKRYQKGAGLKVFVDGRLLASGAGLGRLTARLPKAAANTSVPAEKASGLQSSAENPVPGSMPGVEHHGMRKMRHVSS